MEGKDADNQTEVAWNTRVALLAGLPWTKFLNDTAVPSETVLDTVQSLVVSFQNLTASLKEGLEGTEEALIRLLQVRDL